MTDQNSSTERKSRAGNLADGVYQALRRAIIEQALAPGTKLPEDSVGESFGVSRTVVRSVLARLTVEGLVSQRPNKRAEVASPSLAEARAVFQVRRGLERTVIESLAGHLTPEQARELNAHVAAEERAQGRDGPASIRLSGDFHTLLASMTANELLIRYVQEVASRCSLILALYGRPHSSECAVNEHQAIIDALLRGDEATAVKLMDEHLMAVATRGLLDLKPARERDLKELLAGYRERAAAD
ncbi:GntR family transcriptional regulator [Mesorhizobium sp. VK23B]|uniref:GntR family transcriptional regulator n=1 Tax=Mesorhizobium dulcispinae TaxID=3072316 RepID=A0ABU4XE95_9HYPH|nr:MULTISPECIES: GntR family transcriptional regulator [unclassified Mesorhizobium]MDX8466518.1 GntR family transcriptional regulator [Mesorhizobium sp. VK23B]MDX8472328.1 GntR family transcriptional regulator [Mesorhizobium sp. VK23A]